MKVQKEKGLTREKRERGKKEKEREEEIIWRAILGMKEPQRAKEGKNGFSRLTERSESELKETRIGTRVKNRVRFHR